MFSSSATSIYADNDFSVIPVKPDSSGEKLGSIVLIELWIPYHFKTD